MRCNRGAPENDAKEGVMAKFVQFQAHHLDVSLAAILLRVPYIYLDVHIVMAFEERFLQLREMSKSLCKPSFQ